jgi:uncharacterized cofD-like protein
MSVRRKVMANDPLRIVAIGGGTGLSTLLHGLKDRMHCSATPGEPGIDLDLTAVVTVTDDGGSSGRLRRDFDVLPPGDIRNCLVAMSEDEALLSRIFQYRFHNGQGLRGHSFGNLFLTALSQLTGDFPKAVLLASEILATCGRIYPSTSTNVVLRAKLADGAHVEGETRISKSRSPIQRIQLKPSGCKPMPETLQAIDEADLISLGPGSLFTSVIPNLLVKGIPEAIEKSQALKVYFVNLMWQPGETLNYSASDHVEAIYRHAGRPLIDVAVVNTGPLPVQPQKRYAAKKALPVHNDIELLRELGLKVVERPLAASGPKIRHAPAALADIAIHLAGEGRRRKTVSRARPVLVRTGSSQR